MRKLLIILAVPAMFFLGCKPKASTPSTSTTPPQPTACFTLNKYLIDSGETIVTTNCSTNASTYAWNFGLGLQSSSTENAPTFTYKDSGVFKPVRGQQYTVSLTAFGTGILKSEKDTLITVGKRQIDSVRVINIPGFFPNGTTKIALQFGPGSNSSMYTSPEISPSAMPFTFNMHLATPSIIDIGPTNNQSWKGLIINVSTTQVIYPIPATTTNPGSVTGPSPWPIYFSRGLDNSPIKVTDNAAFEMDVYYSVIP